MSTIIRRKHQDKKLFPDMHPVLAQIYAARNVFSPDELNHNFDHLLPYEQLKGIERAVDLLIEALSKQRRILIVGDFDADGATSCAVAVRALTMMGARHVNFLVPNRFEFGYGLTPEIVEVALQQGPELIVTVDNGIASIEGVTRAQQAGVKVLVTDHHLPGEKLPPADAIVNPNQVGDGFPSKNLAGVGVIFYVMLALRARLRQTDWFERNGLGEPKLAQLLDLVALGTVADVVPLDHNNRILVAQGLKRIRGGVACAGIRALLEVSKRLDANVCAADLGFALGPRLNAAGRLEDMRVGIECLLSENLTQARRLASALDEMNQNRRRIENDMREQAMESLAKQEQLNPADIPMGVCLYDPQWHQGVIGILASRIKEKLHRPVIVFADAGENEVKGSARSISGLHIRDTLDAVATRYPDVLKKFGGHAMAAGLSLPRDKLALFEQAFNEEVSKRLQPQDLEDVVFSDGELAADDLDMNLAGLLEQAGPWGQNFPEPVFDGVFEVVNSRVVGEKHLKLVLRSPGREKLVDGIAFNAEEHIEHGLDRHIHIAYQLGINRYQGSQSLQLLVQHLEQAPG